MRPNSSFKPTAQTNDSRQPAPLHERATSESEPLESSNGSRTQEPRTGLGRRSLTMSRLVTNQSNSNLITALHRQSSFVNGPGRTVVLKYEFVPESPPQKTPREINKFQRFQPHIIRTRPTLLNFRNIVFETYDAKFTQRARPLRIIDLFIKLKFEAKCEPYKMYNWYNFELQIDDGLINGAQNKAESDSVRDILNEESVNHIKLFGHDEYYKYYMWIKFENNSQYFNYYVGELTAVQWQVQVVYETIGVCYLQQLK